MALDFWASRVHSAKHFSAGQATRLNNSDGHLVMDVAEGDDDARALFACPFCYVEIEVPVLCNHLQEEHCFDLKNAVCPICAATLGKDAVGHFTAQHAHSVKRRRKSQKSGGFWSSTSAVIGKDLQELSSFLGSDSASEQSNVDEPSLDPLLSPFLCSMSLSSPTADQEDESLSHVGSTIFDVNSVKESMVDESDGQDCEERRQRAEFLHQLIMSTIF